MTPLAAITSAAVLALLLGLAHCFLGYVMFRVGLVIDGAIGGWLLGGAVVAMLREPSETDLIVAGAVGAVLLAMLAWFLFRAVFALGAGALVALLAATGFGEPIPTYAWALAIAAGVVVAAICYIDMRKLAVLLTSIVGAVMTVAAAGALLADLPWHPAQWVAANLIVGLIAMAATAALAVAGVWVQRASPFFVSNRYAPDRRRRRGGDSRVKPRFTKG
jgi:hypothetical protein